MAESSQAWVTLATNDSYSLGALVLAHSLKRVGTTRRLVVMVTTGVTLVMQDQLRAVFDEVHLVDVLDSKDAVNLALLARPDLGITFTKLHCWRLTNYNKCVFLDADTLVLQPCDELFDREEFSAAPDPGWPDCFNSGVFVFRPNEDTYKSLLSLALSKGSFDGGDQGLLNTYFNDWATRDINRHLPFIYNMCSPSHYSYLPAFKQFGEGVKIAHFIGPNKPWSQYFDSETKQVRPSPTAGHLKYLFQFWWDLFCAHVHPHLSPDMSHRNLILPQLAPYTADSFHLPSTTPNNHPAQNEFPRYSMDHFSIPLKPIKPPDMQLPLLDAIFNTPHTQYPPLQHLAPQQPQITVTAPECEPVSTEIVQSASQSQSNSSQHGNNQNASKVDSEPTIHPPPPNTPTETSNISSDLVPAGQSLNNDQPVVAKSEESSEAGLASAFSQMKLGEPSPAATVELQEHLRRSAWEQGSMDFMGADAFDNIWSKIMDTVNKGPNK
ncbi:glycogenin-1 isoform X2 [Neocloeon triangulifer]|uniref:glycogenin-1 isoform X2 n=1 Tax=Neocloeon triangulifer TaxID=2078957 RepID=UPI00286EE5F0|nr:glycogenin-1 isoform X2 [Neocloeon triangulifer]